MKRITQRFLISFAIVIPVALILIVADIVWGIDDAYAKWGAADMAIHYMEEHEGRWPPDWESLRPLFEVGEGGVGGWSFEHYKSRIDIDFKADPVELRRLSLQADSVPFDVIHAKWTGVTIGDGPNSELYEYFRNVRKQ